MAGWDGVIKYTAIEPRERIIRMMEDSTVSHVMNRY
jgi:hypothetical protein